MFDLASFIEAAGYAGVTAIIFAETGLFFGFFLPGDSLLFTAGILASQGFFNIWLLSALTTTAAIVGDSVGYWPGAKAGPLIFTRPDSFWFSQERVRVAERFFGRFGPISIVVARFLPVVRTFVPVIAGVAGMRYRTFFVYNVVGAFLWAFGIPVLGYYAGNAIPGIERYLIPIVALIVLSSLIPLGYEVLKRRMRG
ncbi:MAG: DedA family protein [Patescibacteria group bacterium]